MVSYVQKAGLMKRRRSRRRTGGVINLKLCIGLIATIIYVIFTVVIFVQMTGKSEVVLQDNLSDVKSVWLSESPLRQTFEAYDLLGVRIWVTNERDIDAGSLVVSVGDEESGEILFEQRVPCSEISNIAFENYLEFRFDEDLVKGEKELYIDLSTEDVKEKRLRTYVTKTASSAADENELYFARIQKSVPAIFVTWIVVSAVLFAAIIVVRGAKERGVSARYTNVIYMSGRERIIFAVLLAIIVCVGLFGDISRSVPSQNIVNLQADDLEGGYTLNEHSSYHQVFSVDEDGLDKINIHLRSYLTNNALFVVSIQKGTDEVLATVQSDELSVSDKTVSAYYIWDISDVELEVGREYDLYIYTGFIEEDEQNPTITGIEYVYE